MTDNRFDRQLPLFGKVGQDQLRATKVVVIGAGGTGCFVIPELALLGVGEITIVDHDHADTTNRNRHLCIRYTDPVPATLKAHAVARYVGELDPTVRVHVLPTSLLTPEAFEAVVAADFVFGCVDLEGVRLVLTELCAAYSKPYIDVASGVEPGAPAQYGGRVCCAMDGKGCLVCLGELDVSEAGRDLESTSQRRDREAIYGVDKAHLGARGPSVVSINGVIASLAVTEFMKACTGLSLPTRLIRYDGRLSRVTVRTDPPMPDCYYCAAVRGAGTAADVERYLRKSDGSPLTNRL